MFPFGQHIPDLPPGASAPQQVPGLANLMQIYPQTGYVNPPLSMPFDNCNSNLPNGNRPPGLMNVPSFNAQNGHLGNSVLGSAPPLPQFLGQNLNVSAFAFNEPLGNLGQNLNQGNPTQLFGHNPFNMPGIQNGQLGWQNQVQNMNPLGSMALLNSSQVAALNQFLGCANQVAQAMVPQTFVGNPQLGVVLPAGVGQYTNFGQQLSAASQQMQSVSLMPSNPALLHPRHSQPPSLLENHGKKPGLHISNSVRHQNKNFMNNPKIVVPNWRFQKSQGPQGNNPKGKHRFSNGNGGKGIISSAHDNSANQSKSGKRRSLAMLYTEKEIHQWREERKKNYPSKANLEKKLADKQTNVDAADKDAKLRRQQLKDVLAKQVELGFEVPDIPSHYLLDPEDKSHGKDRNKKPMTNGRFQNKFNKRGRFDHNNHRFAMKKGTEENGSFRRPKRFAKRQRTEGDDSSKTLLSSRQPTLLQKLLCSDIERDKRRLLQALRFMVINSFFKDWPEKPLNFPKVIVKENGLETEIVQEKSSSLKEELDGSGDDHDSSDDSDGEKDGCEEEGEIPD